MAGSAVRHFHGLKWLAALSLAALAAGAAAACRQAASQPAIPADEAPPTPGTYDAGLTDSARVLAGMRPWASGVHADLVRSEGWQQWQAEIGDQWRQAKAARFDPARGWSDGKLKGHLADCRTVMYPFGGSDILTPYLLVPGCEGYVLVGTEPAGEMPALDALAPDQFDHLTADVKRGLPALFPKSEPPRGQGQAAAAGASQGGLRGVLPLLAVQLVRLNAKIVNAGRFDISTEGRPLEPTPLKGSSAAAPGLTITFELPNGRPQALIYFPAEVDDASLRRRPALWTFLRLQAPYVSFVRATSAFQGERFSLVRDLLLKQSTLVVQDESGIPAPFFKPPDWTTTVHKAAPAAASANGSTRLVAVRQKPR